MYYILEYKYSPLGGVIGNIKREVYIAQDDLASAIYNAEKSVRCKGLKVIEVKEVNSYMPRAEINIHREALK